METISYIALVVGLIAMGLGLIFRTQSTIAMGITGLAIVIVFLIDYTHEQNNDLNGTLEHLMGGKHELEKIKQKS